MEQLLKAAVFIMGKKNVVYNIYYIYIFFNSKGMKGHLMAS